MGRLGDYLREIVESFWGVEEAPCKGGEPCMMDEPACTFYCGGYCTMDMNWDELPDEARLELARKSPRDGVYEEEIARRG